jgi:hypothetical protein
MSNSIVTKYASKASGVYREIVDASQQSDVTAQANVVVVIQSEQGPVMNPIYIKDSTTLHNVFGKRNAKLETKGCYGILMAEHVLEQGPIWVLNVKNINAGTETLDVKHFACNKTDIEQLVQAPISDVYDTTKFWQVSEMFGAYGDGSVLSVANVLNGTATVLITKTVNKDYMYTVAKTKEYNEDFLGDGLDDNAYVSDYLVTVHVFKTYLLTANLSVANAIVGGKVNLSLVEDIQADAKSQYFASYTGTIGNVIDIDGNNLNVCTAINADLYAHGLYAAINSEAMLDNGIDLIGSDAIVFSESGDALPTVSSITRLGYTVTPEHQERGIMLSSSNGTIAYANDVTGLSVGSVLATETTKARISAITFIESQYSLGAKVPGSADAPVMPDGQPFPKNSDGLPIYPSTSVKAGQLVEFQTNKPLWYAIQNLQTQGNWSFTLASASLPDVDTAFVLGMTVLLNGLTYNVNANVVSKLVTNIESAVKSTLESLVSGLTVTVDATLNEVSGDITVVVDTTAVPANCGSLKLTKVVLSGATVLTTSTAGHEMASNIATAVSTVVDLPIDYDTVALAEMYGTETKVYKLTFDSALAFVSGTAGSINVADEVVLVTNGTALFVKNWFDTTLLAPVNVLTGIVSLDSHYVNGTSSRQKAILDKLLTSGIKNSLADPTIFKCRYLVDTFKTYIEPNAKYQYATLAKAADRFLVFIAAPFYHELVTSKNPSFKDSLGKFNMAYVAAGKNPDRPSTNSFSYPTDHDGAMFIVPIMNVVYNDGFASKVVPATGVVAKMFYSKHSGTKKVYDIVAGKDWPVLASGIVKPEFAPDSDDRTYMEKLGTNVLQVITDNNGTSTIQIRSNKTAYQFVRSAFNNPETMEKVLYVSDETEPVLSGKGFKYNNADARLAVKQAADTACDQMVADGAIASYVNTCDTSNNIAEIRNSGILLLDTELYNNNGIRIGVHRTTVKMAE